MMVCGAMCDCSGNGTGESPSLPDTLRVGTLYSPTTLFLFRGDTLGYEYERVMNMAQKKGIPVRFSIAPNMLTLIEMLDSRKIDLVACEVPVTDEYKQRVLSCGTENITTQVLVQPRDMEKISDVTQLVGKEVWVEKGSKYESRLRNLDNEVGGGIIVKTISQDTLITEDLIELVAQKRLPLTVVDSDIAMLNSTYYSNIDVSLEVSFPQRAAWAVARHNTTLADSINAWIETDAVAGANKAVLKRYFEMSKNNPITTQPAAMMLDERHGIVSRYDQIFRRHGAETGLDWRLLAAFSWVETRFTEGKESWAGARGIMQLMPRTAANFGVSGRDIDDPDKNVMAAARYLKELDKIFASRVTDPTERAKFVAAAYNSGHGHVLDAIALAQKHGLNPQRWEANVEMAILWKSKPEYFNDEVCRNGYFRGTETVAFVQKIADAYATFRAKAKN